MKLIVIALIGLSLSFTSCSSQTSKEENKTEQASSIAKRVSKAEFQTALTDLEDFQLIDVRTPGEFANGNLEGSVNVDYKDQGFEAAIDKLAKDKPTLIYCQAGGRSAAAMKVMQELGFQHVLELDGGYSHW